MDHPGEGHAREGHIKLEMEIHVNIFQNIPVTWSSLGLKGDALF